MSTHPPSRPEHAATLVEADGAEIIRSRRRVAAGLDEVWAAITEPDRTGAWAFRLTLEPRRGGALLFDLGDAGTERGTVIEYDRPTTLEYEWDGFGNTPWRVRFELAAVDGTSTHLTLDHLLPAGNHAEFAAGWHWHLDRLEVHLAGGTPPVVDSDDRFEDLLARYQARGLATA